MMHPPGVVAALLLALAGGVPAQEVAGEEPVPGEGSDPGSAAEAIHSPTDMELVGIAVASAARRAAPSVVTIRVERLLPRQDTEPAGERSREESSSPYFRPYDLNTTGVIWSASGEILTTAYNVAGPVERIDVRLPDGRLLPAQRVGFDEWWDVALLKVEARDLPAATRAEEPARVGDWALAVGRDNPLGGHTVSAGTISAVRRRPGENLLDALQTDARLNYTNVGGPLINIRGEMMALTVLQNWNPRINAAGENSGVGFAVPLTRLEGIVDRLRGGARVARIPMPPPENAPLLGVYLEDDIEGRGVLVRRVMDDTAAKEAGLQGSDVILTFAGEKVQQVVQLQRIIRSQKVGDSVPIRLLRGEEELVVHAVLRARPTEER